MNTVERGFWYGICILTAGAFLAGLSIALHYWLAAFVNLGVTVPFGVWGLKNNRESYMLEGRITEIEKQIGGAGKP